jgi:hypothetical protein
MDMKFLILGRESIGTFYEKFRLGDEKIHEPSKQQSSRNHDQKQRNKVSNLRFSLASADDSQNNAHK